jgi:membrane protein required for colicin V production
MGLSLTPVDVMTIVVVLVSAGFAMFRGLIHETLSIVQWLVSGYLALRFTPMLQPLVNRLVATPPPWLEWGVVFPVTFLVLFIPLALLTRRISSAVRKSAAGPADRILGFVYGVGRGLAIVGLVYIVFAALVPPPDYPPALSKARLLPVINMTSGVLRSLIPGANEEHARTTFKNYGASGRRALETLFQTIGGGGDASR